MTYTPQHVANYFLDRADAEGRSMSPLKLIKMVYIAYGWVIALRGDKLFDEPIEAWKHGPVIPSIYHEFKHFGSSPITGDAVSYDLDTGVSARPSISSGDSEIKDILDRVWSAYKHFGGWTLREKTHENGTPWQQTYDERVKSKTIPDELIISHFKSKIREILEAARG